MEIEDLVQRLTLLSEDVSQMAYDRLSTAISDAGRGGAPDPKVVAEERRLTIARRAIDKALKALREPDQEDFGSEIP